MTQIIYGHASGHFIKKCSCGTVISQCRCIGPKTIIVLNDECASCRKEKKGEE